MNRRRYVRALGATVVTATAAGCVTAPQGSEGTPTEGEGTPTEDEGTPTADEGTPTEGEGTPTDTDTPEDTPTPGESDDGGTTVAMITEGEEYYFDPIGLYVEPGTTVTWDNESGAHSSTAYQEGTATAETTRIPEDAEAWDSGILSEAGATFEHTFETPGTYDYFCTPHKTLGMIARIVVGEPGGPAEGSMPPDGDVPESGTIVDQGSVSYEEFSG